MPVQRIEQQNKSCLGDGIKCAAIGSALGYASKWALPLTSQEKDADYIAVIRSIKRNTVRSKNEFLQSIENSPMKTLAQDAYIKSTKDFTKHSVCTYNTALKRIRPSAPFIIAGGITGFLFSFVRNVFKTEVN